MADPTNALTDSATVKSLLGLTGSTYDTEVARVLGAVSEHVQARICKRRLRYEGTPFTEYHSLRVATDILYVDNPPIITITSIHEDPAHEYDAGTALTLDTDYRDHGHLLGQLIREGTWAVGRDAIKIVYSGGYTNVSDVPLDLNEATAEACAWVWDQFRPGDNRKGIASKSKGDGSLSGFLTSLPPHIVHLFDPYCLGLV